MTIATQQTFPVCALPGCASMVTQWGEVCPGCQVACAGYLAPVDREVSDEDVATRYTARDAAVRAAYTARTARQPARTTGRRAAR